MSYAMDEIIKKRQQEKLTKQITQQQIEPVVPLQPQIKEVVQPEIQPTEIVPPTQNFISEEAQIKRFGGIVGSDEYKNYKLEHDVSGKMKSFRTGEKLIEPDISMGEEIYRHMLRPVDDETWDKMSRTDQAKMLGKRAAQVPLGLIIGIPIEIVKLPHKAVLTTKQLLKNFQNGQPWDTPEQNIYMPEHATTLGEIPTLMKAKQIYIESGLRPKTANVLIAFEALGDAAIWTSCFKAVKSFTAPKMKLKPGEQVSRTSQIKTSLEKTKSKVVDSTSEYMFLENAKVVKDYGGKIGDTYLKVTPAGLNSMEVAVIQRVKGLWGKTRQRFEAKFGKDNNKIYQGAMGNEIKLASDIVPVKKVEPTIKKVPVPENIQQGVSEVLTEMELSRPGKREWFEGDLLAPGGGYVKGIPSTFPKWLPPEMRSTKLFESVTEKMGVKGSQFTKPEQRLVEELRREMARKADIPIEEMTLNKIADTYRGFEEVRKAEKIFSDAMIELYETPKIGQAGKLITQKEIGNLETIAKYKDIDDATFRAISKVVTGKQVVGDLTNAEYTSLAKTMGTMAKVDEVAKEMQFGMLGGKFSPAYNYARYIEETTKNTSNFMPIASDVYIPVEDAFRFAKNEIYKWSAKKNDIWGKYNKVQFFEERRLVFDYIKGNKDIILKNEKLIPEVKIDLTNIAERMVSLYEEAGAFYKVDMTRFGRNYQPGYTNIGKFQLYKQDMNLEKTAKSLTAAARYQKRGSIEPVLDDASAVFDIYIRDLNMEKFVQPVVKNIDEGVYKTASNEVKGIIDNYVGEKLGYASEFERKLNHLGSKINGRLGTNMDPEVIKNLTDDMLLSVYSGALGLPRLDAPIRDLITTTMIGYGRMGPRFYGAAVKKAMTKNYIDYMREKGRLVEFGIPGGEEVAKTRLGLGAKRQAFRDIAETTLKPYGTMDNFARGVWSAQAEMQFDDVIARYNAGKITWEKAQKELQLDGMGKPVTRTMEQRILDGNLEGARDLYANNIIDEISFPYRRGTGAPVTYGVGGSLAFNLSNWNIHFAHTMGRWIKTGQWGNFIRFFAAGTVAKRSLEDTLGINADRFTAMGKIVNPTLAPTVQLGANLYEGIIAIKEDNRKKINASSDVIVKTLKALGRPGGVGLVNWDDFRKSYDSAGQFGVPEGMYRVYSKGKFKTKEYADFADILFRGMGFQTQKEAEVSEFLNRGANAKEELKQATAKVKELLIKAGMTSDNAEREKNIQQVDDLMKEFQISGNALNDIFGDFNEPVIQSLYESFSPGLKARFGPRFGELFKQEYNIK